MIAVPVLTGDTLSSIAAAHGVSLATVEADNPQFSGNFNLIYVGQTVYIGGHGGSSSSVRHVDGDGDYDNDTSDAAPSSTPTTVYQAPVKHSVSVTPSYSGGGLSDVPGVPQAFAACVAERESSDGANAAYNGGVYGIITASGINVNGQSLAAQKAAFSKLYAQYGTQPWAPSDGC
jgi:hypothetical protein